MKAFILPVVALLLLQACSSGSSSSECSGKQVTCPSFDDNVSLQWAPYTQDQKIIFNSQAADKDTFNISRVYLSPSSQQSTSATQPTCYAEANFQTAPDNSSFVTKFSLEITLNRNQFNNTVVKYASVGIKGTFFQSAGFSDTGLIKSDDLSMSHYYDSTSIGNKTFSNVQEVYKDTLKMLFKSPQIYKFWTAKNIGIVAFEEYHGKLWVKQ